MKTSLSEHKDWCSASQIWLFLSALPLSLSLSHPFLILCHTHSPSSSFLLYQIEKRCFIWPGTLKAFPLSLLPHPSSQLHPALSPIGPFKIQWERGTNARRLTASWKTHKWTPRGQVPYFQYAIDATSTNINWFHKWEMSHFIALCMRLQPQNYMYTYTELTLVSNVSWLNIKHVIWLNEKTITTINVTIFLSQIW